MWREGSMHCRHSRIHVRQRRKDAIVWTWQYIHQGYTTVLHLHEAWTRNGTRCESIKDPHDAVFPRWQVIWIAFLREAW